MTTGLDIFDKTVQESNLWLKELMAELGTGDRQRAYQILRATLHALRDRIGPENAVHLGAQLPMLLRGVYYEGWRLAASQSKERHMQDFIEHVNRQARFDKDEDPEACIRSVFSVIWDRIDAGEAEKLAEMFPVSIRDLWPRLG